MNRNKNLQTFRSEPTPSTLIAKLFFHAENAGSNIFRNVDKFLSGDTSYVTHPHTHTHTHTHTHAHTHTLTHTHTTHTHTLTHTHHTRTHTHTHTTHTHHTHTRSRPSPPSPLLHFIYLKRFKTGVAKVRQKSYR